MRSFKLSKMKVVILSFFMVGVVVFFVLENYVIDFGSFMPTFGVLFGMITFLIVHIYQSITLYYKSRKAQKGRNEVLRMFALKNTISTSHGDLTFGDKLIINTINKEVVEGYFSNLLHDNLLIVRQESKTVTVAMNEVDGLENEGTDKFYNEPVTLYKIYEYRTSISVVGNKIHSTWSSFFAIWDLLSPAIRACFRNKDSHFASTLELIPNESKRKMFSPRKHHLNLQLQNARQRELFNRYI